MATATNHTNHTRGGKNLHAIRDVCAMKNSNQVLWHPEGTPQRVCSVSIDGRLYAKTAAAAWWALSPPAEIYGWCVPSVKIRAPERISEFERLLHNRGTIAHDRG